MPNTSVSKAPVILIATSAPADLGALPYELERHGLKVRLVTMADAAIAALALGDVALAIVDTAMRQRDGFVLCALIKESDSTCHIPVFLMSAHPTPAERERSSAAGATDYLCQPFDPDLVVEKVLIQLAVAQTIGQPLSHGDPAVRALEVNYHAMLVHSPDAVLLLDLDSGRLIDVNSNACSLFGLSETMLLGQTMELLCPRTQPDGQLSHTRIAEQLQDVLDGNIKVFETTFLHAGGREIPCEMRMVLLPTPSRRLMHVRIVDVTRRNRADQLRVGQGRLLEMVARGAPLADTLDELMHLIERQSEGVICSVLLLDEDGIHVHPASGPSLPSAYMAALEGLPIGPMVGSCGTAMYLREIVIVPDIMHDPLWAPYRALAEPFGLRACWSTPIFLDREQVLGSFAMYYREVRAPDEDDMRLIAVATHLAGIAIERTRRERELTAHREHLEELVEARTAELTLANMELAATLDTLSRAQEELVRRDKLAALGTLVAGVAHELNTPIGNSLVIATTMAEHARGLAANAAEGLRRSSLDSYLAQAEEAGDILVRNLTRAAGLVSSFKQLAVDHANSQRRRFSASDLLAELMPPLRVKARGRPISVEVHIAPDLSMDSYPAALGEVLTSLYNNCLVHAFEGEAGGTIHIVASRRADGMIAFSVSDNGAGIAPELQQRVYDPFFTTKLGLGGSGLGLPVAHNIVTGILGGRMELVSEPGKGTTFTLLLPPVAPDMLPA